MSFRAFGKWILVCLLYAFALPPREEESHDPITLEKTAEEVQ